MSSGDHKPLVIVVGRRIMYEKIDSLNPSEKNLQYAIDFFHTLKNITKSMVSSYQQACLWLPGTKNKQIYYILTQYLIGIDYVKSHSHGIKIVSY